MYLVKANAVVLPSSTTLLSATEILPLKLRTTPKYANLFTVYISNLLKYHSFFCNLFTFKEGRGRYKYRKKTCDMHIQFYLDKRHSIYKTNIMQHCTEISNTKDSFK